MSRDNLARFNADPEDFLYRFVTMDETGVITLCRNKDDIEAMEAYGLSPTQEGQGRSVSEQSHGINLLGCGWDLVD